MLKFTQSVIGILCIVLLAQSIVDAQAGKGQGKMMMYSDTSRTGKPFAKDPSVIKFRNSYLLYYSLPGTAKTGWAVGIARSSDLVHWEKAGEFLPGPSGADAKGLAAPCAVVIENKVHLFYQSYTASKNDAICHAISDDGLHFERDESNPVFQPTASWSAGRAIDADVIEFNGRFFLYCATRDPAMKVQMLAVASTDGKKGFARGTWEDHSLTGPMLKPELAWEQKCIEAPSACVRDGKIYLFYAGAYNCVPQQIGIAVSDDGIHFKRLQDQPLLTNGKPGEWNSSESGHPGIFVDDDGQTYLFYQGSSDQGKTWFLSQVKIRWDQGRPVIADPAQP